MAPQSYELSSVLTVAIIVIIIILFVIVVNIIVALIKSIYRTVTNTIKAAEQDGKAMEANEQSSSPAGDVNSSGNKSTSSAIDSHATGSSPSDANKHPLSAKKRKGKAKES